jgi:recombination protein RecA
MAKNSKTQTMPTGTSKKDLANLAIKQIKDNFGEGSIMKMGEIAQDIEVISSGSLGVDMVLGVGGFGRGRVVEIYGPEASGKTSLALATIAQAQKQGGIAAFVDAEHALDPNLAANIGVNLDELYISQPNNGEEALDIVDNLVRSNAFDIVVVDSVAALVPKSELEGDMGDSSMGVQARLMSQALRKLTAIISKSKTIVIFINQLRLKIGVMFGNPETTTGGQALKFYASQRLEVRKTGALKSGDKTIGIRVKVKVAKNKLASPFGAVEIDLIFDEPGIFSRSSEILDIGQIYELVEKSGNSYSIKFDKETIKLAVGRDNARKALLSQPELMTKVEDAVREKFKQNRSAVVNKDVAATVSNGEDETATEEV